MAHGRIQPAEKRKGSRNPAGVCLNQTTGAPEAIARLTNEQQDKIVQAGAQIDAMLERDIKRFLAYKEQEYQEVKNSLADREALFQYAVKDLKTGEVYSNTSQAQEPRQQPGQALYSVSLPQNYLYNVYLQSMNKYFQQNRLEGTITIPSAAAEYSQIHADYAYYLEIRDRIIQESILGSAALVLALLLFLGIRKFGGGNAGESSESVLAHYRKIPIDVRFLLLLTVCMMALGVVHPSQLFRLPMDLGQVLHFLALYLLTAVAILQIKDWVHLFRNKDEFRNQWNAAYSNTLIKLLQHSMENKSIFFKAVVVFVLTVLLGLIGLSGAWGLAEGAVELFFLAAVYTLLYLFAVLPYLLKRIAAMNSIMAGAQAISEGDFHHVIRESGKGSLARLANHLNNTKVGFKSSLEQQMKSERLKSELITNVSHDLKTPLTSIINYVDLLKNDSISLEEQKSYIEVLDRKTQRLKVLIDDLFEASKMASGATELTLEDVNVTSLLNQALAELNDRIEASPCSFKISVPDEKVMARLDGKKMWRVFENLIGNALKYAMPQTRVHISLNRRREPDGICG